MFAITDDINTNTTFNVVDDSISINIENNVLNTTWAELNPDANIIKGMISVL